MIRALAVTGPTASGKTSLSLALAEALGAEIVCCDSMQIYKRMDIGTAKATSEERARAPHHMLDFLSPDRQYSAEDYRSDALAVAWEITERGRLPIFVGGTGLYIDTLMRGKQESPPSDPALRDELTAIANEEGGVDRLWQMLRECDPASAEKTDKRNVRRVVRALEIFKLTGITKTAFDEASRKVAPDIEIGLITLDFHNRDNLYQRIDERVDIMMREGLLDEVRGLYNDGLLLPEFTSSQAIGYKEIVAYLEEKCTLDEAIAEIKLSSRRYAKRQLTWFRHETDAMRVYMDGEDGKMRDADDIFGEVMSFAKEFIGA